jgi:ATP-dependent helicase HrpA
MSRRSPAEIERRLANLPRPTYPDDLPVVARRDEIARAITENQVVIVCGETGSGKTTQLPKICLELKRGINGMIGHTQPRRLAARTVAARVAAELNTPLGRAVGYKVRFADKVSSDTYIKVMTDGILLAETQGDRMLSAYDTIIIDEAHERSLNIDFLLGYLKRLLPRRPGLKLIVTSATIDAERFARHFANNDMPAPVIEVSGRLYPVEVRYHPPKTDEDDEEEPGQAIVDAVDELARERAGGDILIFLPGEREIRETAETLRKHHPAGAEILPLYARLSFEEQERVFKPSGGRRVVLATNVAETSLTVPGIRYVIDTGLARINRYSYRNKVEQLQIENISRASANQRAGRCGRVAAGVCIRLYAEDDFNARPEFTEPEILRCSLAAAILRMKALKIGNVEDFPFLEAPSPRMIADGYQLLTELGAVDERNELTEIGWRLAKFPIDPRISRMVIAAQQQHCVTEILIIAAALEIQDPRDRPFERADAADQAHSKFHDERSDFLSFVKLWAWFEETLRHKKSNRKLTEQLHENFLSPRRMREWRDVHSQLHTLVSELGIPCNETPATFEQLHRALLAGLLGNIGFKTEEGDAYLGARSIKFAIFPGSGLKKAKPKWVVAAELTETARLYARCVAKIEPEWVEGVAGHLVKRQYFDPHWERKRAMVNAWERVTLYGLTLVSRRRVHYGPINRTEAREVFIRQGLATGEFDTKAPFLANNQRLIAEIRELEHKARRPDVLVDEQALFEFYDALVPAGIHNGAAFEIWRKQSEATQPKLLYMTREYLMRHAASDVSEAQFPGRVSVGDVYLNLAYRFEPSHPLDGITLTVPLHLLNQLDAARFEWLVPGMIREKVSAYLKALPKQLRRHFVPVPDSVTEFLEELDKTFPHPNPLPEGEGTNPPSPAGRRDGDEGNAVKIMRTSSGSLTAALTRYAQRKIGAPVISDVWDKADIPPHLKMNYRVVDDTGRELAMGRDLAKLKSELGQAAQLTFSSAEPGVERSGILKWDFGDLPEQITFTREDRKLTGYPALADEKDSVSIKLFDVRAAADQSTRAGVTRLLRLELKEQMRNLAKVVGDLTQPMMQVRSAIGADDMKEDLIAAITDRAFIGDDALPRNQKEYEAQKGRARTRLPAVSTAACRMFAAIAQEYHLTSQKLGAAKGTLNRVAADLRAQLPRLIYKGFFNATPWEQLQHLPRYVKGMQVRLDKYGGNPERDDRHAIEIAALWKLYSEREEKLRKAGLMNEKLDDFRWQIEELRISLFAQELKTPFPVSVKRLKKIWESANR